ncbi:lipid A biosynthesis lauroyl acyltransferase [Paractinoplanes deccanensis]|uniref:Lipid A biosynthesis lauroyl acyltransferase n=1 Tax=Paractinoplanes deccanensis TaxID=113561 RepID=A0ABQ3Y479_9ACTN|nr:phosphatidylinositol mannoside acyltransferase [Actinoplanes deccanensis]GID74802.1 lipid A biosynthesis lauroyl acyltransferase [Actinoplanes deccanensis]
MKVKHWVIACGYRAAWSLIGAMPERTAYRLFDRIADRLWKVRAAPVLRLEANLLRVLGKDTTPEALAAMSRKGMRSALRYYCEAFRLNGWDRSRIVDSVDIADEDRARLADAIRSERGAVLALGHTGNYDHAGAWLIATHAIEFTTVAENLKPEAVAERFWDYRRKLGMEVLPHDGGPSVVGTLARRLRAGRTVCLVADRDLSASGVPVDFFGETTRIAAGPAALAVLTGCGLYPVSLWYSGPGRMGIRVHPEIPVPPGGTRQEKIAGMTQALADAYAEGIAAHPEDWHMLQPYFLADRPPSLTSP